MELKALRETVASMPKETPISQAGRRCRGRVTDPKREKSTRPKSPQVIGWRETFSTELGDLVQEGQILATISDVRGGRTTSVKALRDGIVVGMTNDTPNGGRRPNPFSTTRLAGFSTYD